MRIQILFAPRVKPVQVDHFNQQNVRRRQIPYALHAVLVRSESMQAKCVHPTRTRFVNHAKPAHQGSTKVQLVMQLIIRSALAVLYAQRISSSNDLAWNHQIQCVRAARHANLLIISRNPVRRTRIQNVSHAKSVEKMNTGQKHAAQLWTQSAQLAPRVRSENICKQNVHEQAIPSVSLAQMRIAHLSQSC